VANSGLNVKEHTVSDEIEIEPHLSEAAQPVVDWEAETKRLRV